MPHSPANPFPLHVELAPARPAVAYVRMSTDLQEYSTENQQDAIMAYAVVHNMHVQRVYADEGKSGVSLRGRLAMQRLLADAQSRQRDFDVILVLDVTRWGRFQDLHEGTDLEREFGRAGVDVHYVSEQFTNDNSFISVIIKIIKQYMAAEYIRELSVKVFAGQKKLVLTGGFHMAGQAGYGLRRAMIDAAGNLKQILERGERKSIQNDRVILVPGPDAEVDIVRWVYAAFLHDGMDERAIAAALNARGIVTDLDRPWTRASIRTLLTNEKYIGNNVFNRTGKTADMKTTRANPEEEWIRADGVYVALIPQDDFWQAKALIDQRAHRFTDEELLAKLRDIYHAHGKLSGVIIDEYADAPSSGVFAKRFGGLIRAYRLIGYTPEMDCRSIMINKQLRQLYPQFRDDLITQLCDTGASVNADSPDQRIVLNQELSLSLVMARCVTTVAGRLRWVIRLETSLAPDFHVAIRMDIDNATPRDYYLLPSLDVTAERVRMAAFNPFYLDCYRSDTLAPVLALARRVAL
jgi:DNA invertase Pin-like site-specific DNA recombinase